MKKVYCDLLADKSEMSNVTLAIIVQKNTVGETFVKRTWQKSMSFVREKQSWFRNENDK